MQGHVKVSWAFAQGLSDADDLVISLHPWAWPDRVATVTAYGGCEVFSCMFAGHVSTDFAYADADRLDALKGRIDLAVAATTGPTRVIIDRVGDEVVRSEMVIDPDGEGRADGVVSYPVRRLRGLLRRSPRREVREFPAV